MWHLFRASLLLLMPLTPWSSVLVLHACLVSSHALLFLTALRFPLFIPRGPPDRHLCAHHPPLVVVVVVILVLRAAGVGLPVVRVNLALRAVGVTLCVVTVISRRKMVPSH